MDSSIDSYGVPLLSAQDKPWLPYRYLLALFTSGIFFNALATRFSFNIALVAMTNFTLDNFNLTSDECPEPQSAGNATIPTGEFPWDSDVQGLLLGAFFYGYVCSQFPGGYLAEVFGAKKVLGVTVLMPGLLCLLTPTVARWSKDALIALRILMGLCQGALYPANHALWGKWAPTLERSQLTTLASAGAVVGMIVAMTLTGYLCSLPYLGGWPLAFYIFGGSSIVWFIVWMLFAYDSPQSHPNLSVYERIHIEQNNSAASHAEDSQSFKRPWKSIFTSVPVWAIFLYSLFDGLAFNILVSGVPIYLKQILKYDITSDGLLSALPYMGNLVTVIASGIIADWIRRKGYLSTVATRKLFAFLGEGFVAACLVGMAFVACNRLLAMILLVVAWAVYGISVASQPVNHLDIAPAYAGTLMGISNVFSNIGGFVSPIIVSKLTHDMPVRSYWQNTFYVASGLFAAATLIWLFFSSGEEQEWAKQKHPSSSSSNGSAGSHSVEDADIINGPYSGVHGSLLDHSRDRREYNVQHSMDLDL